MIKKILDWILGKTNRDTIPTQLSAEEAEKINKEIQETIGKTDTIVTSFEDSPVVVQQKYKTTELEKMKKIELEQLIHKHKINLRTRATKSEMIKELLKL